MPKKAHQARLRVLALPLAAVVAAGVFLGLNSEPTPVSAAPFTCRVNTTFVMPTAAQLFEEHGTFTPRTFSFVAGVDSRCRRNLAKGVYVFRAKIVVSTRLTAGWPEDFSEYPQDADSMFSVYPVGTTPSGDDELDLGDLGSPLSNWSATLRQFSSGMPGTLRPEGVFSSELTELCVAERCTFQSEHAGFFFDPSGEGDFGVELDIENACVPITPANPEAHIWCRPRNQTTAFDYYFHPGLSGARFTVSAEMIFEPLMTWRR